MKLGTYTSDMINVTSSVPQGSYLGPLLFLLFINDLFICLDGASFLFYADDLKIYEKVNNESDAVKMQRIIDKMSSWCSKNGMFLNVDKCSVISFSRRRTIYYHDYSINEIQINRTSVIRDLGVFLDSKMSFKFHVNIIISKANSRLGLIKRFGKEFKDPYVTKALYCSLVRSILEYGTVVWMPFYDIDVKRIESVQKQFLLFCLRDLGWSNGYVLPSYRSRLNLINLLPLSEAFLLSLCL